MAIQLVGVSEKESSQRYMNLIFANVTESEAFSLCPVLKLDRFGLGLEFSH